MSVIENRKATLKSIIRSGPHHFDMESWYTVGGEEYDLNYAGVEGFSIDNCGTSACMAGHGLLAMARVEGLNLTEPYAMDITSELIARWLGVPHDLFYADLWPWGGWGWVPDAWMESRPCREFFTVVGILGFLIDYPEVEVPSLDSAAYVISHVDIRRSAESRLVDRTPDSWERVQGAQATD